MAVYTKHCILFNTGLLLTILRLRTILYRLHAMNKSKPIASLLSLQNGGCARIVSIEGGKRITKRMLSLGLRVGTVINMLNHRGSSVVIQNAGTRVALGSGMVEKLLIEPLDS